MHRESYFSGKKRKKTVTGIIRDRMAECVGIYPAEEFAGDCELHRQTGGTHSCYLGVKTNAYAAWKISEDITHWINVSAMH